MADHRRVLAERSTVQITTLSRSGDDPELVDPEPSTAAATAAERPRRPR